MEFGKKRFIRGILFLTLTVFVLAGLETQAQSQEKYPTRAIDIIAPYAPGGAIDLGARVLAPYVKTKWSVPVNVVNKPGGNTVPAGLEVFHSNPDGYTLLADNLGSTSMLTISMKNLPFKILDRSFIVTVAASPMIFIVPSTSPLKSLKELEVETKKNPGSLTWTSLGGASAQDYSIRQFIKAIDVDVSKTKPIMAQGGSQATVLTAGGHVALGSAAVSSGQPAILAGTVRALAITGNNRHPDLPNIPTFSELGYPSVTCVTWVGLSGPPKLPAHIIEKWEKVIEEMFTDKEIIAKMKNVGLLPFYNNSSEMRKLVVRETEDAAKLWGIN